MVKSEALPIEVGELVFWVSLQTRKITHHGSTEVVMQYWAYLPPGIRPAIIRGIDREMVLAQAQTAITAQTAKQD